MASKQTKRKPQAKVRGRKTNVKLSDLKVGKDAAVKGGGTTTTTSTVPVENVSLSFAKIVVEY